MLNSSDEITCAQAKKVEEVLTRYYRYLADLRIALAREGVPQNDRVMTDLLDAENSAHVVMVSWRYMCVPSGVGGVERRLK